MSLRGHGGSGGALLRARVRDHVSDLRRLVGTLDRPPVLVGHSMGAFVVQKYLESDTAAGAVLLAPMPHTGMAACMRRMFRIDPAAILLMHALLGLGRPRLGVATVRRLLCSQAVSEASVRRLRSRLQGESFFTYLDMMGLDLCRPRHGAVPMLVIGAAEDAMFTRGEVEAVAAAHGAPVEFASGMAHAMMLEPGWETVVDRIAEWADALRPRADRPRDPYVRPRHDIPVPPPTEHGPARVITEQRFIDLPDFRAKREAWIEAAQPLYRTDIDADWGFDDAAYIRNYNLGSCILGTCHAPQMRSERTLEQISRQSVDHLSFRVFLSGTSDLQVEGKTSDIRAGHLQVLDMAQPMRSHSRGSKPVLHLIVPRRSFERRLGDLSAFHGAMLDPAHSPVTRLMIDHMRSLTACIDAADEGQRAALTSASVSMVNAVLTPAGKGSPYAPETVLGLTIRRFVEDDLAAFDLGIEKLCARFALSRTALYDVFEADGGVASYIRDRRLSRAMRILAGLEGEGRRRISSVGYACGFETEKMFSRAFKRKYGVNPSEVDAGFRPQARLEYGATLMSWINAL